MRKNIDLSQRINLLLYAGLILFIYIACTAYFGGTFLNAKNSATNNHAIRMTPDLVEAGKTPPDPLPPTGNFVNVNVGTYFDSIYDFSIADSKFSAIFYVWFSWKGGKTLDPGKHFQLIDAKINSKELVYENYGDDGVNYQRYVVDATMIKFYNTARISLDDHMLNIYIEDAARDGRKLRYVADDKNSAVSSRVKIPGYTITESKNVVKNHTYKSTYGDPTLTDAHKETFTQYIAAVSINRSSWGFYLKLVVPFVIAVCLGLATLWSRPCDTDSRFGLAGASLFGVVANAYIVNSLLPPADGSYSLVDSLSTMSILSVFLVVASSIASLNIYSKWEQERLAFAFDRVAFASITIGFAIFNIAMPFCAYLSN